MFVGIEYVYDENIKGAPRSLNDNVYQFGFLVNVSFVGDGINSSDVQIRLTKMKLPASTGIESWLE